MLRGAGLMLDNDAIHRAQFSSLTPESIKRAFARPVLLGLWGIGI